MPDSLDDQLRAFLDGALPPAAEQAALHAIAEDAEARALLRFEHRLQRTFAAPPQPMVNSDFADRVMDSLALPSSPIRQEPLWIRLGQWLWQPYRWAWRPAYGLGVLLLLAVAWLIPQSASDAYEVHPTTDAVETVLIRFMYVHEEASSVAVAGDFSNWEPIPLTWQDVDGQAVWTAEVLVPRQSHRYMFLLNDDTWVTDPLALLHEDDGFGRQNAVLTFL